MTKQELIRDLCSVEFRTKSKTRELVEAFVKSNNIPEGVSQWRARGKQYGYWDYFRNEIIIELSNN